MVLSTSIDDIFRQKSLHEIHAILKQTRSDVETKKQDIRELVGDHYRSVLESSDHIRAMSDCAARISSSSQRLEELLESMQSLAHELPATAPGTQPARRAGASKGSAAPPAEDRNYRLGLRVMDLLEVPDTVRGHLADLEFLQATRLALVDSSSIRAEVDALLAEGEGEGAQDTDFDIYSLAQQQVQALRSLPLQISSSCLDAFSSARLEVTSGVQSFVIRLLLEQSVQPLDLLKTFFASRSELLAGLGRGSRRSVPGRDGAPASPSGSELATLCGSRLAAAAMALEGTVVVSVALAPGASQAASRSAALFQVLEAVSQALAGQNADLARRAQGLREKLLDVRGAEETGAELARLGQKLVREWASGHSSKIGALLAQMIESAASSDGPGCRVLAEILAVANEKVFAYRRAVCSQLGEPDWETVWQQSCKRFCPSGPSPPDAASLVATAVDNALAEVAKERVASLELDLNCGAPPAGASAHGDDGSYAGTRKAGAQEDTEQQFSEAIREFRAATLHRVQTFDFHLGEIISDAELGTTSTSSLPLPVTSALLEAVATIIERAASEVHLPEVAPIWPSTDPPTLPAPSVLRHAARAAIALEVLTGLAEVPAMSTLSSAAPTKLQGLLKAATSSGDPTTASKAQRLLETLRRRSDAAFVSWARSSLLAEAPPSRDSFWSLTEEEVLSVCSWGTATFNNKTSGVAGKEERAVSVPMQASPYVFQRLALASRRMRQVSAGASASNGLIAATKAALTESFLSVFKPEVEAIHTRKKNCMNQLLQWLFDLHILRLVLSSSRATEVDGKGTSKESYNALRTLQDEAEAGILSDPVDRLLYQPVMKAGVRSQIQSVRVVWDPFFVDNSLFGFQFKGQADASGGMAETSSSSPPPFSSSLRTTSGADLSSGDGFQLQPSKQQLFRQVQSRFPLLPVAMGASALGSPTASDQQRGANHPSSSSPMGFGTAPGVNPDRAVAAAAAAASSLAQQVGSGLGSLGFNKAFNPMGASSWATSALQGWGAGAAGTGKAPENV